MKKFLFDRISEIGYFEEGRLPAHSDHTFSASEKETFNRRSSFEMPLDGRWKFHYAKNPKAVVEGFSAPDFDCGSWGSIAVPGCLQMQGYDSPIYTNVTYPWDGFEEIHPGQVPTLFNPVGQYLRDFALPKNAAGKKVILTLDGAESAAAVFLNGRYVGYATNSFVPNSFELTPYLREGRNRLGILVIKWTSASWCEDQDFFRFSGLQRSIRLSFVPDLHLYDIHTETTFDESMGKAFLKVCLRGTGQGKVTARLYEGEPERGMEKAECLAETETSFSGAGLLADAMKGKAAAFRMTVGSPKLWSAEKPNLYTLLLIMKKNGKTEEAVTQVIGFRKVEIRDGQLLLNGKRIVFKGVNRHEFSAQGGHTVTRKQMLTDVLTMKRNNINAIRTCHYPDSSYLYELCDRYGLYMMDENNLESHGLWDACVRSRKNSRKYLAPGDRSEWLAPMLDRVTSTCLRDRNHPAVIMWSCGNESFGGRVIYEMSRHFRKLDGTRPVHYEGIYHDMRYPDTSDVQSQMYPPVERIISDMKKDPSKPFICCEYSHAMGNSCGALYKYTNLAYSHPQYQGGFIWDYIDQSLTKKDRYGKEFQAYGGDFDDRPNDGNFSGDGIVYGRDRDPSPKMQEVRFCYQDIEAEVTDRRVTVRNRFLFTNTNEFGCDVILSRDGKIIRRGMLQTDVGPLSEKDYALPFRRETQPGEYTVTVSFYLRENEPWADAGHEVAFGQHVYRIASREKKPAAGGGMRVVHGTEILGIHGSEWSMLFSAQAGCLISYRFHGHEMMVTPPEAEFWRAPTDNDRGNAMPFRYSLWKTAGLYAKPVSTDPMVREGKDSVCVSWKYQMPFEMGSGYGIRYEAFSDGTLSVTLEMKTPEALPAPPAFGILFRMKEDYDHLKWYGLGPEETYADRKSGAKLGIYETTASGSLAKYLVPQETGNRMGVRWAEVTDASGNGLHFTGDEMDFSILPYTPHELENARHAYELPEVHYTVVRASLAQMGVGGDDSWGALTHPEFLLPTGRTVRFSFSMKGISKEETAKKLSERGNHE